MTSEVPRDRGVFVASFRAFMGVFDSTLECRPPLLVDDSQKLIVDSLDTKKEVYAMIAQ